MMNQGLLRQMQRQLQKIQDDLEKETVEATAGGGAVTVVVNGHLTVQAITIDPAAVDPDDVEMLQDLITVAVNDGLEKAKELAKQRMSVLTGGMKMPGLI